VCKLEALGLTLRLGSTLFEIGSLIRLIWKYPVSLNIFLDFLWHVITFWSTLCCSINPPIGGKNEAKGRYA
jgi:hypothetical protein